MLYALRLYSYVSEISGTSGFGVDFESTRDTKIIGRYIRHGDNTT